MGTNEKQSAPPHSTLTRTTHGSTLPAREYRSESENGYIVKRCPFIKLTFEEMQFPVDQKSTDYFKELG